MTGYLNCVRFEVPLLSGAFIFFFPEKKIVVTHGFKKKTRKTPQNEIIRAKKYREDYFKRGNRR